MFRGSIKLGTILGITIRLDYSWFIIFFLITWSLSAHRLPALYPDWTPATYWILGIITSILFFTSVLIHEMAHSLVARRHGIPINNITLFIFGGAAQITQEPKQAKDEFMMAFAGPRFDSSRFGSEVFRFSPRQADVMIVAGTTTYKMARVVRKIYDQMPDPKWVIAMGACTSSGGMYRTYSVVQGIDQFLPVDLYVAGCPPRPDNLLHALMTLQQKIQRRESKGSTLGLVGEFPHHKPKSPIVA